MSQCDRCNNSPVKAFSLGGFHAELCIDCLNEWEEMEFSDPYAKERLEIEILIDWIEHRCTKNILVTHEEIVEANTRSFNLGKMLFFIAKRFVLGDEPEKD